MNRVINHLIKEALKKVKDEPKEATGAGSAGPSEPKLGLFSDDETARSEYKRLPKVEGEFTEATTSIGAYDAPGFEDVNMRGNNPVGRGRSFKKTQIPGGGFVGIDKKCKKFPYCSQGNSKDKPVKIITPSKGKRKKSPLSEAIENISFKTGLSVDEIKNIILKTINKTL